MLHVVQLYCIQLCTTFSISINNVSNPAKWKKEYLDPQTRDTRPCAILIPAWGWIWGLRVFPVIKILVVCQVHVLPACTTVWAWRQSSAKTLHGVRRSWTHLFCVCFYVCGRQKPEDPQIEPRSWRRHYMGWYVWYLWCICVWTLQKLWGPSKFNIKSPNDPWQFLLISTTSGNNLAVQSISPPWNGRFNVTLMGAFHQISEWHLLLLSIVAMQ